MYFSWTDIDEIHGDQFRKHHVEQVSFSSLIAPAELPGGVKSLQLKDIAGKPFYLVNDERLIDAQTGEEKQGISEGEALAIAGKFMREDLGIAGIEMIEETGDHHEYRGGPLPAYVISYETAENIKAYVSVSDGSFQTLRHRDWRWFDFLWMTHTMDYEGRDDFNNLVLRIFSLLGLITVLSGFVLWYISSPSVRKFLKKF